MNDKEFKPFPPKEKFAKIPNGLFTFLTPNEIAVYVYIAGQVIDWDFSARRIEKEMIGISRNTVDKALKGLEKKGFLRRFTLSNRKMRYRLFYIEAEYAKSLFEQCKEGSHSSEFNAFSYYLDQFNSYFTHKHIHLTDKQIIRDCEPITRACDNGSLDNDLFRSYVSKFLNDENHNTDKHFPVFINYIAGELDESYRGYCGSEALSKAERIEFL